jgi:pilus assembly protein CpaE
MNTIRVHCAGDWNGLQALLDGLANEPELKPEAIESADVVLLVAAQPLVPRSELEAIRAATAAPVLLLAADPADALLDAADAFGLADVVPLPQPASAVAFAIRKAARASRPAVGETTRGPARVLTIFSPKGGTGKSVTACNLAASASARGLRTLLLDLDLQFGDVSIMLGLEPRKTLLDLVSDLGALDSEKLRGYVSTHPLGIEVLPAPLRPEDSERVSEERIAQLLDVARHVYDVIVVDTSPYFHGPMLTTLDRTDELLLVSAPDVPTLKNLRLTLHTLDLLGFAREHAHVVLNRADPRVGLKAGEVGAVLGHRVDFQLPNDPSVPAAVNRGVPVIVACKRAPFSQAFAPMASELLGDAAVSRAKHRPRGLRLALGWR